MDTAPHPVPEVAAPGTQPPSARRVSPEAFLQATCIAWGLLAPAERKAIRTTCRSGRLQHDSLLTHLRVTLGHVCAKQPVEGAPSQRPRTWPSPTPSQLEGVLRAVVSRGARLLSLTVWFKDGNDEQREAKLLAALAACSGWPLSRLELAGAVPLSEGVAYAVHGCCPQLSSLCLDHRKDNKGFSTPLRPRPAWESTDAYHLGCKRLLELCGPRLTDLQLRGVYGWRSLSYMTLRYCAALASLQLEAGWRHPGPDGCYRGQYAENPTVEADVFGVVGQLETLRSLHLCVIPVYYATPEALAAHATCAAHLRTLTVLTHLELQLTGRHETLGDRWELQQRGHPLHRQAWGEAQEVHRTSLLSALRAMPQLQHVHCRTLSLQPAELASLTALTSVTLNELLPPPAVTAAPPAAQRQASGPPDAAGMLPSQLQQLTLLGEASPQALAQLQILPCLTRLVVPLMRFGTSDVDEEGRLTAEAVAAVGPAVRLLLACGGGGQPEICIRGDGGPERLLPREGSPTGHMEWIQQLQGLDACCSLELRNVALRTGDVCCLGKTLPGLRGLALEDCSLPMASLPALRPAMGQLASLRVDLRHHDFPDGAQDEELESVLLLLCRPHAGALPLRSLECSYLPDWMELVDVQERVLQQLATDLGETGVHLCLMHE